MLYTSLQEEILPSRQDVDEALANASVLILIWGNLKFGRKSKEFSNLLNISLLLVSEVVIKIAS